MMRHPGRWLGAVALVAALGLTGCASERSTTDYSGSDNPRIAVETVTLPDGRQVLCVLYSGNGIDCDFDHPITQGG